MSRANGANQHSLPTEIRRQIHTAVNTRYLRTLPAFRADDELPAEFQKLLGKLDRAERRGTTRRRS